MGDGTNYGPAFFQWTQPYPVALSAHYTATKAIATMRTSLSGSWPQGTFEDLYFPNPSPAPPISANDTTDYKAAANAFVCQAISNGDTDWQGCCDCDGTQTAVDAFNNQLWSENFDRYVDWFAWDESTKITGAQCTYQEYYDAITNPDWISLKKAEQTDGTWSNQSLDMFMHFLKLTALGATADQIQSIYTTITAPTDPTQPSLMASGFLDVTPSTFMNYQAYLLPLTDGAVTYPQLSVTNLNSKYFVVSAGDPGRGWNYADEDFLNMAGYWEEPPVGSCLVAGTRVVLADGVTTKPIEQIQPGDEILSPSYENERAARKCLFLSRATRKGRSLFSYHDHDGIKFTPTHPILAGYDQFGQPILHFVDVQSAVRSNPTWAAFENMSLSRENLIEDICTQSRFNEVLYDVILEDQPGAIAAYVVEDKNGKRTTVCTEGPDSLLLPDMTTFIFGFLTGISQHDNASGFFPHGLESIDIRYSAKLSSLRSNCIQKARHISDSKTHIRKEDLGIVFAGAPLPFQALLGSIEALLKRTGLSVQAEFDNFWLRPYEQQAASKDAGSTIMSSHFIYLKGDSISKPSSGNANDYPVVIHRNTSTKSDGDGGVPAKVLASKMIGPYLYHHHCIAVIPKQQVDDIQTLEIELHGTRFITRGHIHYGNVFRWPLHLRDLATLSHVGWIELTAENINMGGLEYVEKIIPETNNYATSVQAYAKALGEAFGKDVLSRIR
ncbi:hypothetical protein EYR41_010969 [Orbilia oligospora]|uniref:Hint domain-containing protein n=1 Tax=Orbilia oligospora TaxID=2813651 RepID=A0A8H2DP29_ORBOL|nr:hypothetical protein EYR41_010969 [Orbilia oligospora]